MKTEDKQEQEAAAKDDHADADEEKSEEANENKGGLSKFMIGIIIFIGVSIICL